MRKNSKCLVLFLLLAALLSLTGCHGSRKKSEFVLPEAFDTSKQYEITFWAKNDTNKAQTDIYKKAISDFQAIYPNITVNLRLYTDYGKIYNDVITNIATNTTPNVCITYPDHIATYRTGDNVVIPLDQLMQDSKYGLGGSEVLFDSPTKEEIIAPFLSECMQDGQYYALPYMRSTEALYINKTYVEKLGYKIPDVLTWDFIWEVSEAALKKYADGTYIVNDQKVLIPFIYKSTDNMMIQILKQAGFGYSSPKGDVDLFHQDTKDLLTTISKHTGTGAFSTFKLSGYPANFLNAGQCIFAIDSTAGSTWMGCDAPLMDISEDALVDFVTEVRMIPQWDPKNPQMISQGPSLCLFNKEDSGEVLASWLFAQYLLSNDVQIAYAQTEGYVPVTSKAQNSTEYQDYLSRGGEDNSTYYSVKIQASKLLLENMDNTFVTPVFNGSTSLRDAAGSLIENTVKSTKRKATVDDAYFEKLFSETTTLYHLDERGENAVGKATLGKMPLPSVILLAVLGITWFFIGLYALNLALKQRNMGKNHN